MRFLETNSTKAGASSSWSVQPRVNHLLFWNSDSQDSALDLLLIPEEGTYTSNKKT
jgi:hypothetical protein